MAFAEGLRNYRASQHPDLETTRAQGPAIAQELLEKAHARQLLEEVQEFWRVGEIVATPLSLTFVYRFPVASKVSSRFFYNDEATGIDDRYLAEKYYPDENFGHAINIKPFAHSGFGRFDPYHCLRIRIKPPRIFEPSSVYDEGIEGCDYDLLRLLQQGTQTDSHSSKIECIRPDEQAADRLRARMLAAVHSDNYPYGNSPLHREQAARSELDKLKQQGKLYPSKEELLQAAREEQASATALQTLKRTGLARLFSH